MNSKCSKICPVPTCNCQTDEECEIKIDKDGCEYANCICNAGYIKKRNSYGSYECVPDCDENQCKAMNSNKYDGPTCPQHSYCKNICIGFECNCLDGYEKKNGKCVPGCDMNQCEHAIEDDGLVCPTNSKCVDKCNDYDCVCNHGFRMIKGNCVPTCDENQCDR